MAAWRSRNYYIGELLCSCMVKGVGGELPRSLASTGYGIWVASGKMTAQVARLDDIADDLDNSLITGFKGRADARLSSLSNEFGRDVRAQNYGWLELVNRSRDGPGKLDRSGIVVQGDAKRRLYGVLLPLASGSASVRRPQFYGPIFPPSGAPEWQFFTGDSMCDKNGSHSLRLGYPDIARLLNSESTYAEIVRFG